MPQPCMTLTIMHNVVSLFDGEPILGVLDVANGLLRSPFVHFGRRALAGTRSIMDTEGVNSDHQ